MVSVALLDVARRSSRARSKPDRFDQQEVNIRKRKKRGMQSESLHNSSGLREGDIMPGRSAMSSTLEDEAVLNESDAHTSLRHEPNDEGNNSTLVEFVESSSTPLDKTLGVDLKLVSSCLDDEPSENNGATENQHQSLSEASVLHEDSVSVSIVIPDSVGVNLKNTLRPSCPPIETEVTRRSARARTKPDRFDQQAANYSKRKKSGDKSKNWGEKDSVSVKGSVHGSKARASSNGAENDVGESITEAQGTSNALHNGNSGCTTRRAGSDAGQPQPSKEWRNPTEMARQEASAKVGSVDSDACIDDNMVVRSRRVRTQPKRLGSPIISYRSDDDDSASKPRKNAKAKAVTGELDGDDLRQSDATGDCKPTYTFEAKQGHFIQRPLPLPVYHPVSTVEELGDWTHEQIMQLKRAHGAVDPTSATFWVDVSELVDEKSPEDCSNKWYSLSKTPMVKSKMAAKQKGGRTGSTKSLFSDDDIFDSTPMRDYACSTKSAHELDNEVFGSAIKVGGSSATGQLHHITKAGYKTYVQDLRRKINRENKANKKKMPKRDGTMAPKTKTLTRMITNGGITTSARLSPGGTLRLKSNYDSEDDFWGELSDEEE